jgi:hypothetical protein
LSAVAVQVYDVATEVDSAKVSCAHIGRSDFPARKLRQQFTTGEAIINIALNRPFDALILRHTQPRSCNPAPDELNFAFGGPV